MTRVIKSHRFNLLQAALLWLVSGPLQADWINLTGAEIAPNIAEIHIHDDRVQVKLEVYVGHIPVFQQLVPDEWLEGFEADRPSLQQRQQRFAHEGLKITTGDGTVLPARFDRVEPRNRVDRRSPFAGKINPYNLNRLPDAPADKRVLYAEISYPFESKPQRLVISPPLDEQGDSRVNLGFITYHENAPVTDFRYLNQAEALDLDWQDPWYSRYANKNLTRHHRYPIMLFLYAEPRRVRSEAIMRIADLEQMLDFQRDELSDDNDMRALLEARMMDYHREQNLLTIDQRLAYPDRVRVEYLRAGLSGIKIVEQPVDLSDASLLVGVKLEYFVNALPDNVEYEWRYFNQYFDRIPVTVNDPAGPLSNFIDRESAVISWNNYLKQYEEPAASPVRVQTGWNMDLPYLGSVRVLDRLPDAEQATAIVEGVLANLRAAFIEVQPAHLDRQLGTVTAAGGPGYLGTELGKLFAPEVSGGNNGEVHEFQDLQVAVTRELEPANGFSATVDGTADIRARHWGHLDQRRVRFQLLLDLVEPEGRWQLADVTVVDLKQEN